MKTVPWTGYTDIQRCEMTRGMTMTAPNADFADLCADSDGALLRGSLAVL